MSRHAMNPDIWKREDLLENFQSLAFGNSHTPHASIDLEIDGDRRAVRNPIEVFCFLERGNCGDEPELGDRRPFLRQGGTKNDDRKGNRFTERQRLLQVRHAEKLHLTRERFRHAEQTMAVSIRFYYSEHLR